MCSTCRETSNTTAKVITKWIFNIQAQFTGSWFQNKLGLHPKTCNPSYKAALQASTKPLYCCRPMYKVRIHAPVAPPTKGAASGIEQATPPTGSSIYAKQQNGRGSWFYLSSRVQEHETEMGQISNQFRMIFLLFNISYFVSPKAHTR